MIRAAGLRKGDERFFGRWNLNRCGGYPGPRSDVRSSMVLALALVVPGAVGCRSRTLQPLGGSGTLGGRGARLGGRGRPVTLRRVLAAALADAAVTAWRGPRGRRRRAGRDRRAGGRDGGVCRGRPRVGADAGAAPRTMRSRCRACSSCRSRSRCCARSDAASWISIARSRSAPGRPPRAGAGRSPPGTWTIRALLEAMVVQSDNVACDKLLALVGGPAAVDARMRALGVRGDRASASASAR